MRTLGILSSDSGGASGVRTRLRNQMKRLFSATVQLIYEADRAPAKLARSRTPIFVHGRGSNRVVVECPERKPDQPMLWESKIYLGEKFFNEIIRHPVPIEMNTLKALKRPAFVGLGSLPMGGLPHLHASRCDCRSPGGRCTVSSAWTRTRPATSKPSRTSAVRFSAS